MKGKIIKVEDFFRDFPKLLKDKSIFESITVKVCPMYLEEFVCNKA